MSQQIEKLMRKVAEAERRRNDPRTSAASLLRVRSSCRLCLPLRAAEVAVAVEKRLVLLSVLEQARAQVPRVLPIRLGAPAPVRLRRHPHHQPLVGVVCDLAALECGGASRNLLRSQAVPRPPSSDSAPG